jgi:hypothetical protein
MRESRVMPDAPVPTLTEFAVENDTTGQVDYLKFQGSTLVQTKLFDYGLGAGWDVVSHLSATELLAQNADTGLIDLLFLDTHGAVIGSALGSVSLPQIVGGGDFTGSLSNPLNPIDQQAFVSQLPDGELDMLRFNTQTGALIKSDLVPNTAGFAPVVGAGGAIDPVDVGVIAQLPALARLGVADNVFLQLPNGQVDAIGFNGSFEDHSLSVASSLLLPTALTEVQAVNQTALFGSPSNLDNEQFGIPPGGPPPTVIQSAAAQMVSRLPDGSFDLLFVNSGYDQLGLGAGSGEGALYASNLLNLSMPGWHVVDANVVAAQVFS